MDKLLTQIILLFCLTGCGKATVVPLDIPADFTAQVAQFMSMAKLSGSSVSLVGVKIQFYALAADQYGFCSKNPTPTVLINRGLWQTLTALQKNVLIAHELGHCVLGREHVEQAIQIDPTAPLSIMRAKLFTDEELNKDPLHYSWELFNPGDFSRYGWGTGYTWI